MLARTYGTDLALGINYRLRLALTADAGLGAAHGMARLARSGQWPVLSDGAFQFAVASLIHMARPHDPATPLPLPDLDDERRLCGLAFWLGQFDAAHRTGAVPVLPATGRREVDGLLSMVIDLFIDDMLALVRAAATGPFAQRRRAAGAPAIAAPGNAIGGLGVGECADAIAHHSLIVFCTTTDTGALAHRKEAEPLLRQLVGQLLLDTTDPAALRHLAVYLPRQVVGATWPLDRLLAICAGPAPRRTLAEHRAHLRAAYTVTPPGSPSSRVRSPQGDEPQRPLRPGR
jgi:hypothetical protein